MNNTATKVVTRDYFQFFDDFTPEKNHLDPQATMDGELFETYGSELEYVLKVHSRHPDRVWTVTDTDGIVAITDGFHIVNRMGYLITRESADPSTVYSYYDEDDELDYEDEDGDNAVN